MLTEESFAIPARILSNGEAPPPFDPRSAENYCDAVRYESLVRLLVAGSVIVATHVQGQSVDFDSAGDLQNKFDILPGNNGTNYSQVSTGGITGGAVDVL